MHVQEFVWDKIKCEVADKLCMASHIAKRASVLPSPGSYPRDSWNKVQKPWI